MTGWPQQARSSRTLGLVALATIVFSAMFAALGVWQVKRLHWKLALIERVDARVHASAGPLPERSTWPELTAESAEFLRVQVSGHYLHDKETLVHAVTELGGGYWVLTPMTTDKGYSVLINRGFVDRQHREPATRPVSRQAGPTSITGLLRLTEPHGAFLRTNDPVANRWFSRDVTAIAATRDLKDVAPFFVDADSAPGSVQWPVGGLTRVRFTNDHLVYALTWFTLALMVLTGGGYMLYDAKRNR